jgi:uncharacterized protein
LINRSLYDFLERWKLSSSRLPLILRGARQVGKTTLVNHFSKKYDRYLYFNLEKSTDAKYFIENKDIHALVQVLFLIRNIRHETNQSVLIFIDEIQEVPFAISQLRYFQEEYPHLHVIASGSLLDIALSKIEKIPVGRVEYAELHPLSFQEFLLANGKNEMVDLLNNSIPMSNNFSTPLYDVFHEYTMLGGMPMIVKNYIEERSLVRIKELFNGITESYKSDVSKYAKNQNEAAIIRQIIDAIPYLVDNRINMSKFGNLTFKASDIKNSLFTLQQARLIELVYPTTFTLPPILPDTHKRPRLHYLDIGLLNHQLGLHQEYLTVNDLNNIAEGSLIQQVVNQEIKAQSYLSTATKGFWVREEKGTSSEIDIVFPYKNLLVPIEVKSGASGTLRSLHEYIDRCDHHYAVRIYGGALKVDTLKTRKNKSYKLLNLPYFLSGWISKYLDWFVGSY